MSNKQNSYFEFFNEKIPQTFRNDTNNRIESYFFYLVYPHVFIRSNEPYKHEAKILVKKNDLIIKPDSFSFFKFIEKYPECCEPIIKSCLPLQVLYEAWFRKK